MHCARCGASAIAGALKCYRCEAVFEEPSFSFAPPPAPNAPVGVVVRPQAQARARAPAPVGPAWPAALGFVALALVSLVDVLALDDSPFFLVLPLGYGALAVLAWRRLARGACITVAAIGLALGLLAAAGGGVLVGALMAVASAGTLLGLLLPLRSRGLMATAAQG